MTWELIFLGCFAFGFVLCLIAFLAGSPHLHLHVHHQVHGLHGHGHPGAAQKMNFGTFAAFLTWFGGAGYILTKWGGVGLVVILMLAALTGFAGALIIFLFTAKVLAPGDKPLDPEDFRVEGALGTVSCPVLPGGTGEMIFVQQGRRSSLSIRSEDGVAIPAGKEVVVTRYEQGIAWVREWDVLTA
jgi:hypothetical protein